MSPTLWTVSAHEAPGFRTTYQEKECGKVERKAERVQVRESAKSTLRYLSPQERQKYELAEALGLLERVKDVGWAGLSAKETGRIGGLIGQGNRRRSAPLRD